MMELVKNHLDLVIVIGGFNSSNTCHLAEIAQQHAPAYHIDEANCIISDKDIRHKPVGKPVSIVSSSWLPASAALTIGVTAGASTPNRVIGDAIERIIQVRGYSPDLLKKALA
jgi:4-hydroxy-3-methylbut-2-enyl diphosphate reductase